MQIEIQSPQFPMTSALNHFLRRQIKGHLSPRTDLIRSVQAYMSDVNGLRGGADKRCRLVVRLSRAPAIVVESIDADLYRAIKRATQRLGRAVVRRKGKRTLARRRQGQPLTSADRPASGDAGSTERDRVALSEGGLS